MDEACNNDADEDLKIMKMTRNRIEKQLSINGFREGALEGKDRKFQENFDDGYNKGYKQGYQAGIKAGEQRILCFVNKDSKLQEKIEKPVISLDNMCSTNED